MKAIQFKSLQPQCEMRWENIRITSYSEAAYFEFMLYVRTKSLSVKRDYWIPIGYVYDFVCDVEKLCQGEKNAASLYPLDLTELEFQLNRNDNMAQLNLKVIDGEGYGYANFAFPVMLDSLHAIMEELRKEVAQ